VHRACIGRASGGGAGGGDASGNRAMPFVDNLLASAYSCAIMPDSGWTRRDFLKGVTAAAAGCLAAGLPAPARSAPPSSPDVILFVSDQHRFDALGCLDGSYYTPNLDAFAGQGVCFTNAFCASPVCAPSRAAMMTGRYPHQTGVMRNGISLGDNAWTVAQEFRQRGYHTAHFGKWHLGTDPGLHGFDTVAPRSLPRTRQFTDQALEFLRAWDRSRPLFMVVSWLLPHPPYEFIREYASRIPLDAVTLPPTYGNGLEDRPEWYQRMAAQKNLVLHLDDPRTARRIGRRYRTMVALVDQWFGEVTALLRDLGMHDGSIIAYTADHGEMMAAHGLTDKHVAFDESIRVPWLMRVPGSSPVRQAVDDLVSTTSLPGTLLAAAGLSIPPSFSGGESWSRALAPQAPPDQAIFFEHRRYRAVRTTWGKLVSQYGDRDEYNDLAIDPLEKVNRIDSPAFQVERQVLQQQLDDWWLTTDGARSRRLNSGLRAREGLS
jgi:arylsulfatase A-like enzyme